jgi:hypothetical protein
MIRHLLGAGALALAISPALAQEGADPHDHIRLPYLKYPEDVPTPAVKVAPRKDRGHRVLEGHRSANAPTGRSRGPH